MQATNSGFLKASELSAQTIKITVYWHIGNAQLISIEEQRLSTNKLVSALESELTKVQGNTKLSDIPIKALVAKVETISEPLN